MTSPTSSSPAACRPARTPVGPVAGGGVGVLAGDVGDAGASAGDQVLDGQPAGADVVGGDRQVGGVVGRRVGVDDRDGDVVAERRAGVGLPADDDEPVDAAAEQRAQVVLLADGVAAGVAEEHVDLAGAERVLGAHEDRDDEPALEVAGEQADGAGAPGEQAAGERVGAERQPLGGLDDALAGACP